MRDRQVLGGMCVRSIPSPAPSWGRSEPDGVCSRAAVDSVLRARLIRPASARCPWAAGGAPNWPSRAASGAPPRCFADRGGKAVAASDRRGTAGDGRVGEAGQRRHAPRALRQAPAARLRAAEVPLRCSKGMLRLGPNQPLRRPPPRCPVAARRASLPPATPTPYPGSSPACPRPDSPSRPTPAPRRRAEARAPWPRPRRSPKPSPGCAPSKPTRRLRLAQQIFHPRIVRVVELKRSGSARQSEGNAEDCFCFRSSSSVDAAFSLVSVGVVKLRGGWLLAADGFAAGG